MSSDSDSESDEVECHPFRNELMIKINRPELKQICITHWVPMHMPRIDIKDVGITANDGIECWELADVPEYIVHKLRHLMPKSFCYHCFREFSDEKKLTEHLREEKISIPKTFKAYSMGKPIPILFQYDENVLKDFRCRVCPIECSNSDEFQKHLKTHKRSEVPYCCHKCKFLAFHYQPFLDHHKQIHANTITCPFCYIDLDVEGLRVHWYDLNRGLKVRMRDCMLDIFRHIKMHLDKKRELGCEKCLASFLDFGHLRFHEMEHQDK